MTGDVSPQEIKVAEDPLVMLGQLRGAISGLQFHQLGETGPHAAVPCLQKLALGIQLHRLLGSQAGLTKLYLCRQSTFIMELRMVLYSLYDIFFHSSCKDDGLHGC